MEAVRSARLEFVDRPDWRTADGTLISQPDAAHHWWFRVPHIRMGNNYYAGRLRTEAAVWNFRVLELCGLSVPDQEFQVAHERPLTDWRETDLLYQATENIVGESICAKSGGWLRKDLPPEAVEAVFGAFLAVRRYLRLAKAGGPNANPAAQYVHWDMAKPEQYVWGYCAGDARPRLYLKDTDVQELMHVGSGWLSEGEANLRYWERSLRATYPQESEHHLGSRAWNRPPESAIPDIDIRLASEYDLI